MDEMVLSAQKWLNATYTGRTGYTPIEENGKTGTIVMEALVTALQIDLGIASPTGYFGDQTAAAYNNHKISKESTDSSMNLVRILQHGLFCKGYNPTGVTGYFGENTEIAVVQVQTDAGFTSSQISYVVDAKIFKAILSSDALVLVPWGDPKIRQIQQALNRSYTAYIGIKPCDGVYSRETNLALIYALQAEGGMSTSVANGNFGPGTTTIAQNHTLMLGSTEVNFVKIVQYALYCNGSQRSSVNRFDPGNFDGVFDTAMALAVSEFQDFVALGETGIVNLSTWMSLLCSKGNPDRDVIGCDCATQLTATKVQTLINNGYQIVGRYLTGTVGGTQPKNLTVSELQTIFANGMRVFAIYQDERQYYMDNPDEETSENYFSYTQGYNDAEKACSAAVNLGIPYGEYIYFAVDFDFMDSQVTSKIIPHFQGINDYMNTHGNKYSIGVYGARNICSRVCLRAYASSSFVADMSTGYSGNLGYILPANWAFDQIKEYTQSSSDGSFGLDKDAVSGRYTGFNHIVTTTQTDLTNEDLALNFYTLIMRYLDLIPISSLALSNSYTFLLGGFEVTVKGVYGEQIKRNSYLSYDQVYINGGLIPDESWSTAINLSNEVALSTGVSRNSNGLFELSEDIQWQIHDGYISYGITVREDLKLEQHIIIHKDEVSSGSSFVEIGISIVTLDSLPQEAINAYSSLEEVRNEIDWQFIFNVALGCLLLSAAIIIIVAQPEIAPFVINFCSAFIARLATT